MHVGVDVHACGCLFWISTTVTGVPQIVMQDVFVPAENLLPNKQGLGAPFGCLNSARCVVW